MRGRGGTGIGAEKPRQADDRRQPVDPQRVDLHRLAGPGRHRHPVRPGRPSRSAPRPARPAGAARRRVGADAVPGARQVWSTTPRSAGSSSAARSVSPVDRHVPVDRVQEPQRRVGGVVLDAGRCPPCSPASPRTGSRRTPAAGRGPRRRGRSTGTAPRTRSSCRATRPRTTGSRRPRPVPAAVRTTNGPRPRRAWRPRRRRARRPPRPRGCAAGRRGHHLGGRRRSRVEVAGPRPHRAGVARRAASAVKRPACHRSSSAVQPAGRLLAVVHAAPPRRRRAPSPGPASRYAPSTTAAVGHGSTCGAGPSARRSPCASRQVHSASRRQPDRAAGDQPVHHRHARPAVHGGHLAFDHDVADAASASGAAPSVRSKRSSSSKPRGSTAPEVHSWAPSRTRAPEGSATVGSSAGQRQAAGRRAGRRRRPAGRGSGGSAARSPCPWRSRRGRRRPATPGRRPRRARRTTCGPNTSCAQLILRWNRTRVRNTPREQSQCGRLRDGRSEHER